MRGLGRLGRRRRREPAILPRDRLEHYPRLQGEHPHHWIFPDYLDNPRCAWLASLKELYGHPISFPASLSPEAGLLLHSLIRNLQPRRILEVGVFVSVSTHWMAGALLESGVEPDETGRIHCFDDFGPIHRGPWRNVEMLTGREHFVREHLAAAGLQALVRLHAGDSSTLIRGMRATLRAAGGVDFAFVDGDHSPRGVTADFQALEPVLNTGGYVLLHDTFPEQCGDHLGPRFLLDHVDELSDARYERVELYLSPLNYGMGLLRRVG